MKRRHEDTNTESQLDTLIALRSRAVVATQTKNHRELAKIMQTMTEIRNGSWHSAEILLTSAMSASDGDQV